MYINVPEKLITIFEGVTRFLNFQNDFLICSLQLEIIEKDTLNVSINLIEINFLTLPFIGISGIVMP